MTLGAGEFIENIKHRKLGWANSTILRQKLNRTQKPHHHGWKDPVDLARSDPVRSSATVGPAMPNHAVTGWLVLFSCGLGVTHLLLVQKTWESLFWVTGKEEKLKIHALFLKSDGDTVSPWLYVTLMEEKPLRWEQAKGPESISTGWDQHSQHALSGRACYSQGPSRQGTGSLRRLWGPHLWRSAHPHWIKLWAAWSDIPFCSKRSSSDKVAFIVNYSLIL